MADPKPLKDAIYTPPLNTPEEVDHAIKIMDNAFGEEEDNEE